jgi:hypothetical protein
MSPLTNLAPDLWTVDAEWSPGGFALGARATVARLPDGGLWLHSPVALTPERRAALDALGPVTDIVAPSRMHFAHVRETAAAYPAARVWAPALLLPRLSGLSPRLLPESPPAEWQGAVDLAPFRGSRLYDEHDFHYRFPNGAGGALILTDLLFNVPRSRPPLTRFLAGAMGFLGRAAVSRTFALTVGDRTQVRASLERLLAWEWDCLILSHGECVPSGGRDAFRDAFDRYLHPPNTP